MKNIYKIINDINDLVYVGQTKYSIDKRLKQHWYESKRARCENRPLYKAFNTLGFKHFSIVLLEQCEDNIANEREVYWIKKFNSFIDGYNDTYGGKGKHQIDYQEVIDLYNKFTNIAMISRLLNKSIDEIRYILHINNIQIFSGNVVSAKLSSKRVNQYEINGNLIASYDSVREVERKTGFCNSNISAVCLGKRKTAYGFKWEFA